MVKYYEGDENMKYNPNAYGDSKNKISGDMVLAIIQICLVFALLIMNVILFVNDQGNVYKEILTALRILGLQVTGWFIVLFISKWRGKLT